MTLWHHHYVTIMTGQLKCWVSVTLVQSPEHYSLSLRPGNSLWFLIRVLTKTESRLLQPALQCLWMHWGTHRVCKHLIIAAGQSRHIHNKVRTTRSRHTGPQIHTVPIISPLLSLLTQLLCRKPMAFEDGKNLSLLERCRKRKKRENKHSIVYPDTPPAVRHIRKIIVLS